MADKTDPPAPPATDPPKGAEGDPPKDPPKPPAEESVEETVRRVLAEVLPDLIAGGDDGTGAGGSGDGTGGEPPSPASVEKMAEQAVRKAMEKLREQGATEDRLERIEKVIKEEAPKTYRRLTKFLWGDEEKARTRT